MAGRVLLPVLGTEAGLSADPGIGEAVDPARGGQVAVGVVVGPDETGLVDLGLLIGVLHDSRGLLGTGECGEKKSDEQRDDRDDHQQLDEGETVALSHVWGLQEARSLKRNSAIG